MTPVQIIYKLVCRATDIMTAGELAKITGLPLSQVRKAIDLIRKKRKICSCNTRNGGYWLDGKPFAPKNIVPFAV